MKIFKNAIKEFLLCLSFENRIKLRMLIEVGYIPNLNNPKTFNEKTQYRKSTPPSRLMTICADKYAVRQYVEDKIGSKYLIPLLYHSNTVTAEDLKKIKCDAVVKSTHDSGQIHFITAMDNNNFSKIASNVNKSLTIDFGRLNDERWYSNIIPSVIVEKKMVTLNGNIPFDYKFHMFETDNEAEMIIQVDYDRFTNHSQTFYDENGEKLFFSNNYKNEYREFPNKSNLIKMIELAKKLSKGFGYVRVDLYDVDGDIYFGEITFAHKSGFGKFSDKKVDYEWGKKWRI